MQDLTFLFCAPLDCFSSCEKAQSKIGNNIERSKASSLDKSEERPRQAQRSVIVYKVNQLVLILTPHLSQWQWLLCTLKIFFLVAMLLVNTEDGA